jgi:hypothetical protein
MSYDKECPICGLDAYDIEEMGCEECNCSRYGWLAEAAPLLMIIAFTVILGLAASALASVI